MWNYRIIHYPHPLHPSGDDYWIGEVYYNEDGEPEGYSGPIGACGETLEDLGQQFEMMAVALEKPVIEAWLGRVS